MKIVNLYTGENQLEDRRGKFGTHLEFGHESRD